jgi:hypothetical protein
MSENIRAKGAKFALSNSLPQMVKKEFSYVSRTKKEVKDTDYAVYGNKDYKTVIDAAMLPQQVGQPWPEKITLTVTDKGIVSVD